jgi:hypothetical protein
MLRDELTGRLEALGPGEGLVGLRPGARAAFAAAYKDGQQGLLLAALEELEALAGGGLEEDAEGAFCGRRRWSTALASGRCS